MSTARPNAVLLSDGGLPALVAAAIEAERHIGGGGAGHAETTGMVSGAVSFVPWPGCEVLAAVQYAAVSAMARFFQCTLYEPVALCAEKGEVSAGLYETLGLLAGVEAARRVGCSRVIWPVQYHRTSQDDPSGQLDRIAAAVDRALLVSRLGLLESTGKVADEITIETPLVDLTAQQVADLAVDLDAPAYLCWWWRRLDEIEAEASVERRIWLPVLEEAGWVQQTLERASG